MSYGEIFKLITGHLNEHSIFQKNLEEKHCKGLKIYRDFATTTTNKESQLADDFGSNDLKDPNFHAFDPFQNNKVLCFPQNHDLIKGNVLVFYFWGLSQEYKKIIQLQKCESDEEQASCTKSFHLSSGKDSEEEKEKVNHASNTKTTSRSPSTLSLPIIKEASNESS